MRILLTLMAVISLFSLPGCHCCGWSEYYADQIDDVADEADFKKGLDDVYIEKLDVSRWCMNRRCPPCQCPHCY